MARGLAEAGHDVGGPLARDYPGEALAGAEIVLLCVPDREIAAAAAAWRGHGGDDGGDVLLGHCSGATDLLALRGPEGDTGRLFSLHPLMTFADATPRWAGAAGAVAGSSASALATATELARDLGLAPVSIADGDRPAYHAAASVASNYLVTLLCAAETLAASGGVTREMLAPLVRQAVENWVADGAGALTGPIVRGDEDTVRRQRAAVAARVPELLELFDGLTAATRVIAPSARDPRGLAAGELPGAAA